LKEYDYEVKSSKFDITYIVREQEGTLHFSTEYCTKLFKEDTILRFIGYFTQVIHSVLEDKECAAKLSEIEILPDEEKEKLLVRFNNTETVYPTDKTIHELFEERVEKVPDQIAVIFEEKKISFRELNERANRLAGSLIESGVRPDAVVGVFCYRRLELMAAIFAILKAGAVFLPLDPNFPEKRITYMLKASNVSIVLTDNRLLSGSGFSLLDLTEEASYKHDWVGAPGLNNPGNLAYIIW
jgi:non-ribosomal peptide synthetase component F